MIRMNLLDLAWAFGEALDAPGEGTVEGFRMGHGRRVAYVSVRLAEALGLEPRLRAWLVYLALLHDLGISEGLRSSEQGEDLMRAHSVFGEENIRDILFTAGEQARDVLRYHHERWDGSGPFRRKGEEIPLLARILSAADHLDLFYDHDTPYYRQKEAVGFFLAQSEGTFMDPWVARVLRRLTETEEFWLDFAMVDERKVRRRVGTELGLRIGLEDLLRFALVMSRVIDRRSEFTARHSDGLVEKLTLVSLHYGFDEERYVKLQVAGYLHDLGKMLVPRAIIEKQGPLTAEEFEVMKSHAYHTKRCLERIEGFEEIAVWAGNHHERLNGRGYPGRIVPVSLEERLLAALDVFQALAEERPYRKAMPREEVRTVMDGMVAKGELDGRVVEDLFRIL